MKVFFDQGVPVPLRNVLPGHVVETAYERGWSTLENGELLDTVEADGFEVFITTDQNLKHQQNLDDRDFAVVVLMTTSWPLISTRVDEIRTTIDDVDAGEYVEVAI